MVYRRPLSKGWAIPGGIVGIVLSGTTMGLGTAAEIYAKKVKNVIDEETDKEGDIDWYDVVHDHRHFKQNRKLSFIFGGISVGMTALGTPLVFLAGKSARNGDPRVRGMMGLRITSWIAYGLSLAVGVLGESLAIGPSHGYLALGVMASSAALGMVSILCMSLDAFISGVQASRAIRQDAMSNQRAENRKQFQWTVAAAPVVSSAGSLSGASVGVVGVF